MPGNNNFKNKNQKWWLILIGCILIGLFFISGCNSKPKVYRVGMMLQNMSGINPFVDIENGFKKKMTELGYIEGTNIVYDLHRTVDPAEEQRVLKKFLQDKVDLIFVSPTGQALEAKEAVKGTKIPVLFAMAMTEENNLIESVRQPGGNITGVREPGPDITVKRLEILHELAPKAGRIYIPYDPNYPASSPVLKVLRPAALSMGISLVEAPVKNAKDIQSDLKSRAASVDIGIDAILILGQPVCNLPESFEIINSFAIKHKVPVGGFLMPSREQSVIFGYDPDYEVYGLLAAALADKILKGTPAGTIPVVSPEASLRLNYKLAKKLGLNVSESILSRAKEIIR